MLLLVLLLLPKEQASQATKISTEPQMLDARLGAYLMPPAPPKNSMCEGAYRESGAREGTCPFRLFVRDRVLNVLEVNF